MHFQMYFKNTELMLLRGSSQHLVIRRSLVPTGVVQGICGYMAYPLIFQSALCIFTFKSPLIRTQ